MELDNKKLENNEINKEGLDNVSGGYVYNAGKDAAVKSMRFEVIDDKTGRVLGRYSSQREAKKMAKVKGQSADKIKNLEQF